MKLPTNKHPKILGLTFDPKHTYSTHIQNTHKKTTQTINLLKALTTTHWGKCKETLTTYKTIAQPITEYANSVVPHCLRHKHIQTTDNTKQYAQLQDAHSTPTQHTYTQKRKYSSYPHTSKYTPQTTSTTPITQPAQIHPKTTTTQKDETNYIQQQLHLQSWHNTTEHLIHYSKTKPNTDTLSHCSLTQTKWATQQSTRHTSPRHPQHWTNTHTHETHTSTTPHKQILTLTLTCEKYHPTPLCNTHTPYSHAQTWTPHYPRSTSGWGRWRQRLLSPGGGRSWGDHRRLREGTTLMSRVGWSRHHHHLKTSCMESISIPIYITLE